MRHVRTVLAGLLLLLSAELRAQCAPIPGTGCPGQAPGACMTSPRIGTTFRFQCSPGCSTTRTGILGTPTAPQPLPSPPMCMPGCSLGCTPMVFLPLFGDWSLPIPNDPTLVGAQACIQCVCVPTSGACVYLGQAVLVTIQ